MEAAIVQPTGFVHRRYPNPAEVSGEDTMEVRWHVTVSGRREQTARIPAERVHFQSSRLVSTTRLLGMRLSPKEGKMHLHQGMILSFRSIGAKGLA
jgi:hypothetical protein